jgi:hypothetical protein
MQFAKGENWIVSGSWTLYKMVYVNM